MGRAEVIGELTRRVLAIRRPHPTRVAIDGRSAAGKTTFADALAAALDGCGRQVLRAGIDDFHPPGHSDRSRGGGYTPQSRYEEAYDYAAFERLLLAPMGPGGDRRLTLALHDSFHERPIEGAGAVAAPDAIVIVDGAFLLRPELRSHWDMSVWLDVGFETVLARAVVRDVAWVGDADKVRRNYLRGWIPTHQLYEATDPMAAADIVIDNEDPAQPRIVVDRRA